jgi:hypothetical protein
MASASVFGPEPKKITVNYAPHAGQNEVSDALEANFYGPNPASVVEIIASRGWGKTLWLVCDVLIPYMNTHANAKIMWVAPNYQTAMSPIEDVFRGTDELTGERWVPEFDPFGNRIWEFKTTASGPQLQWYNGAIVTLKSADAPESIVSRGYNLIIIDEVALIQERVFTQQILGTARKAGIKIFMISSPRGKKHWTHNVYLKGQDPKETDYLSFSQPYHKNPHFSPILAKLIKDLPDWLYRQEYLAEFIEDGDSVFRGLEHIIDGPEISFPSQQQEWAGVLKDLTITTPDEDDRIVKVDSRRFVVAMDLAKSVDFTVITAMDLDTGECVYYKRFNKTDYKIVLKEAVATCRRYNNADLIFDATGVGSGLSDFLENDDITTHPYVFTNESKCELVNRLALSIEYQEIKIPNITTIKNELSVFTYELTRTGKVSYNAPSGFHDDIVMSLALANWYRKENGGPNDTVTVLEEIIDINNSSGPRRRSFMDDMHEDND